MSHVALAIRFVVKFLVKYQDERHAQAACLFQQLEGVSQALDMIPADAHPLLLGLHAEVRGGHE